MPESAKVSVTPRPVRCAIYTRKSSEVGLEQAFNSLHAQREAAEAYILSQQQEGWLALPEKYDDGGATGGNMERPALRKLMAAIEAGQVDCVVVYKVDRLSRSLLDFARMIGAFEKRGVSFVSVTQQFNTSTPVGRLTLNILLSFAQFEREIISERTRDKQWAARKKGKWTGGYLVLGYDLDAHRKRLIVNPKEACQVRALFKLVAKHGSLRPALAEAERRGWRTKTWMTLQKKRHSGGGFGESSLLRLLRNPLYKGLVRHNGKLYPGEHAAIVDAAVWEEANERIGNRLPKERKKRKGEGGALLQGLLQCGGCGGQMAHTSTAPRGHPYRYYVCAGNRSAGSQPCAQQRVSAPAIEQSVVQQIHILAEHPEGVQARELLGIVGIKWKSTSPEHQRHLLRSLVDRLTYDAATGRVTIRLRQAQEKHG